MLIYSELQLFQRKRRATTMACIIIVLPTYLIPRGFRVSSRRKHQAVLQIRFFSSEHLVHLSQMEDKEKLFRSDLDRVTIYNETFRRFAQNREILLQEGALLMQGNSSSQRTQGNTRSEL